MARVYLDSNVFFYAKIMDRAFGKSCSNVLRKVASGAVDASTSALVAVEVANALRKYGLAKEVTAEVRAIFSLGMEVFHLDATDVREAAEIFAEANIGPYDCAHAAIMRRNGVKEIISADKEFDKINWLKRLDPRSFDDRVPSTEAP
jgi:predicted nucleic acid-binding protein